MTTCKDPVWSSERLSYLMFFMAIVFLQRYNPLACFARDGRCEYCIDSWQPSFMLYHQVILNHAHCQKFTERLLLRVLCMAKLKAPGRCWCKRACQTTQIHASSNINSRLIHKPLMLMSFKFKFKLTSFKFALERQELLLYAP